jgi:formylglycine-generating enzyme required for sulfatase activity
MKRIFALAAACVFVLGVTSMQVLAQTQAKGLATVANGFVVAVSVTDGGSGYAHAPNVTFVGGGGSGATATAVLSQGSVSQIVVLTAGFGYTNTPSVVIDPPQVITQSQATALASVLNGFVVSVTVTDAGSGYTLVPNVAFTGGGGSGATATAVLSTGTVAKIVVLSAGAGYTNAPTVTIDPPVMQAALSLDMLARVKLEGAVGTTYAVEFTDSLAQTNSWQLLANVTLTNSVQYIIDTSSAGKPDRFYRANPISMFNPDPNSLVWVAAGTFVMGSPDSEVGRSAAEGPLTTVTLTSGYFIRKYVVTQQEYQAVMGVNPSNFPGDQRPVEMVVFQDAVTFCQKLTTNAAQAGNLPAGMVYRLPTEAEWEYACRAGTTNRFYFGDDPNYTQLPNYAWYVANSGAATHPVGQKLANPLGLYDMSGNVWEWCWGSYTSSLPGGALTDPAPPVVAANGGVVRGGSWYHSPESCRSAARSWWSYGLANGAIGFRVVLAKPLAQ